MGSGLEFDFKGVGASLQVIYWRGDHGPAIASAISRGPLSHHGKMKRTQGYLSLRC
jgi:hypothetical protein